MVIWHLKLTGKVKEWVPHELTKFKKKSSFWSAISYSMQQQWTISRSDGDMRWKVDFIQQLATNSSVVGLGRCSKVFPKAKLAPKTGHGHCSVVCCWPVPLQLSESWWKHYIWEVGSAIDEMHQKLKCLQLALVNRKGPTLFHNNTWPHNQNFKSWMNWAMTICLICCIYLTLCQVTTASSSISTTDCRANAFTTSRRQKMLPKSLPNPEAWNFTLQE